jgi:hypothetical protein
MAVGLTDHVWTLQDVLLYRVPLWSRLMWCKEWVNMMSMMQDSTSLLTSRSTGLHEVVKTHCKG